ncbi:MAG: hypothetical protein AAGH76_09295 [Pseudomonadota bacterium]
MRITTLLLSLGIASGVASDSLAHDACAKLDCQRLAAKIERAEAKLRRKHSLREGKKLKANLIEWRAEQRRFCRRYSR